MFVTIKKNYAEQRILLRQVPIYYGKVVLRQRDERPDRHFQPVLQESSGKQQLGCRKRCG